MKHKFILSKEKTQIFRSFLDEYLNKNVSRVDVDLIDTLSSVAWQIRDKNYITRERIEI